MKTAFVVSTFSIGASAITTKGNDAAPTGKKIAKNMIPGLLMASGASAQLPSCDAWIDDGGNLVVPEDVNVGYFACRGEHISGNVVMQNNPTVTTLILDIQSVGANVVLSNNPMLNAFDVGVVAAPDDDLDIGGSINVENNPALQTAGFRFTKTLGGSLTYNNNPAMLADGVYTFESVGGSITYDSNSQLKLVGMYALESVGESITVNNMGNMGDESGKGTYFGSSSSGLGHIGGDFVFTYNPLVSDVIVPQEMDGNFVIENNDMLRRPAGSFPRYVGGDVSIQNNNGPMNLSPGLSVETVGGNMWVRNNPYLSDFNLGSLTKVGKDLEFVNNPEAQIISASFLSEIGGEFVFQGNDNVVQFDSNIVTVGGTALFDANAKLETLNIQAMTPKNLVITNNPELGKTECPVASSKQRFADGIYLKGQGLKIPDDIFISNNAKLSCLPIPGLEFARDFVVINNDNLKFIDLTYYGNATQGLTIDNNIILQDNDSLQTATGVLTTNINGELDVTNNIDLRNVNFQTEENSLGTVSGNCVAPSCTACQINFSDAFAYDCTNGM